MTELGQVYLVGAGPGDPELLTLKGWRCLQAADVVLHDRLVSSAVLAMANPNALLINVGKAPSRQRYPQAAINALLCEHAQAGKIVVRLKGGDPFVFGRGSEEAQALRAAGIPYTVVPGVSSAIAAPAYAGIPVTHRNLASSFTVVAGQQQTEDAQPNWKVLAQSETLVFLMGVANLPNIVHSLREHGLADTTPAVVIANATTPAQQVVVGCLQNIERLAQDMQPPATLVVGKVAALAHQLDWFVSSAVGEMPFQPGS